LKGGIQNQRPTSVGGEQKTGSGKNPREHPGLLVLENSDTGDLSHKRPANQGREKKRGGESPNNPGRSRSSRDSPSRIKKGTERVRKVKEEIEQKTEEVETSTLIEIERNRFQDGREGGKDPGALQKIGLAR